MEPEIARFIQARLDEEESDAKSATPGRWLGDPTGTVCAASDVVTDGQGGEILPEGGPMEVAECYRNERQGERGHNAAHIARHDPASVLARVESDRRIVEACVATLDNEDHGYVLAGQVLALMAARHPSHADYRAEWAPDREETQWTGTS